MNDSRRNYLSMADRQYDDSLPPEHIHNRIATMQAKQRNRCECGHAKDNHSYSHVQAAAWCCECPQWCDA